LKKNIKIYLVKHGKSIYSKDGRIQGHIDIPLSEEGSRQAAKPAKKLAREILEERLNILAVYSSDLLRALQTAEFTIKKLREAGISFPVRHREDLREIKLGVWEGKTRKQLFSEIEKDEKSLFEKWIDNPREIIPEGAESMPDFFDRSVSAFSQIVSNHGENGGGEKDTILIFAHGGFLSMIMNRIQNRNPDDLIISIFPNATGLVIDIDLEKSKTLNGEIFHLEMTNRWRRIWT